MSSDESMCDAYSAYGGSDLDAAAGWTGDAATGQTFTPFYAPLSGRATCQDACAVGQQQQPVPSGVNFSSELQDIVHGSMALASSLSISATGPTTRCANHSSISTQGPLAGSGHCLSISASSNFISTNAHRSGPLVYSYIPVSVAPKADNSSNSYPAVLAPQQLSQAPTVNVLTGNLVPMTPTGQRLRRPAAPPAVKTTKPLFKYTVDAAGTSCSQVAELNERQQQLQRVQDWLAAAHC